MKPKTKKVMVRTKNRMAMVKMVRMRMERVQMEIRHLRSKR